MHNITLIEYYWALLSKVALGLAKKWGFYLERYLVSVILSLLVYVWCMSKGRHHIFLPSFDYTKPAIPKDWETSKRFGEK